MDERSLRRQAAGQAKNYYKLTKNHDDDFDHRVSAYIYNLFSANLRIYDTIFLRPSVFLPFYECMVHFTFGYDKSNELAFNKLLFDVPVMCPRDVTKQFFLNL